MSDQKTGFEQRIVELLEELVKWTKAANYDKLFNILRQVLKTERQRFIYQDTGIKSRDEIRKEYNIGPNKLTRLRDGWVKRGFLARKGGKYIRLFDLNDFELLPKKKTQGEMPLNAEEKESEQEERTEDN